MTGARGRRAGVAAVVVAAVWAVAAAGTAGAHVLIRPDRVPPHTLELLTVLSPDEQSVPLTGLRLAIPGTVIVSSVGDTPGYRAQIVRDQSFRPVALSWQGGRTLPGHLALFHFAALTPANAGPVTLTGVQTFADGSTRIWRSARIVVADPAAGRSGGHDGLLLTAALVLAAAGLAVGTAALRRGRAR